MSAIKTITFGYEIVKVWENIHLACSNQGYIILQLSLLIFNQYAKYNIIGMTRYRLKFENVLNSAEICYE